MHGLYSQGVIYYYFGSVDASVVSAVATSCSTFEVAAKSLAYVGYPS
jgi:hypothetical protein